MINMKDITRGVEKLLNDKLSDYTIRRNPERNADYDLAAKNKGWIGIYRGDLDYDAGFIGNKPWSAHPNVVVEIQAASFKSGADAEEKLQDAEQEVMDVLTGDKTLNGTVAMTLGYSITYEKHEEPGENIHFQASIITIKGEVRA